MHWPKRDQKIRRPAEARRSYFGKPGHCPSRFTPPPPTRLRSRRPSRLKKRDAAEDCCPTTLTACRDSPRHPGHQHRTSPSNWRSNSKKLETSAKQLKTLLEADYPRQATVDLCQVRKTSPDWRRSSSCSPSLRSIF